MANNPLELLKIATQKVPVVKYAMGIVGIAAAIAIIHGLQIGNTDIPVVSILAMLGLMILLFVFATLTRSSDGTLKMAGYILVYATILLTVASSILLLTSIFIDFPKPFAEIVGTGKRPVVPEQQHNANKSIPSLIISNDDDATFMVNGHFIGNLEAKDGKVSYDVDSARIYIGKAFRIQGQSTYIRSIRMVLAAQFPNGWMPISKSDQFLVNKEIAGEGQFYRNLKFQLDVPSGVALNQCWLVMMVYTIIPPKIEANTPIHSEHELF
jgi:heme/copper-type cytochrome/quinol oxidase subunit 4